jgi:hypothetical protein
MGGRLHALIELEIRWGWLLFVALVMQVLAISVFPHAHGSLPAATHVASYALAGTVVVVNRKIRGVALIGAGGMLNMVAIIANRGVMPASPNAVEAAGLARASDAFANSQVLEHPQVSWLGDVFALPASWPIHNVFSIGDVLIVLGGLILLHVVCGSRVVEFLPFVNQAP